MDDDPVPGDRSHRRRRALRWGIGAGIASSLCAYLLVALPVYTFAAYDRQGLDRPQFRDALVRVGIPVGTVIGVVCGILVARWILQGRTWSSTHRDGIGAQDEEPTIHDDWPI